MLLVDSDYLCYLCGHGSQTLDKESGELKVLPESVVLNMVDNCIYDWCEQTESDEALLFVTGPINFRYNLATYQPYKGNRVDQVKPYHFNLIKNYLIEEWKARVSDGVEADDEICIEQYSSGNKHIVLSSDKDLKQCVGKLFTPSLKRLGKVVREASMSEVTVDDAHYFLCTQLLTGDTADHIPGLHQIGPKKAEKYLNELRWKDRQAVVRKLYNDDDRLQEIGGLLHILRSHDDYYDVNAERWR